jgi:hypothetical protein
MMTMPLARMIRTWLGVAGAALAGFHAWLFAAQAAGGRLEDPWLVFRWVAAASLVVALVGVRNRGESVWSRKGIAIWVLAALLHGPAVASDLRADFNSLALPETVATTVLQLASWAAIGASLWLLAGLLAARRRSAPIRYATMAVLAATGSLAPGVLRPSAPRPPPSRS